MGVPSSWRASAARPDGYKLYQGYGEALFGAGIRSAPGPIQRTPSIQIVFDNVDERGGGPVDEFRLQAMLREVPAEHKAVFEIEREGPVLDSAVAGGAPVPYPLSRSWRANSPTGTSSSCSLNGQGSAEMIAVLKDIEEIDAETSEDCNPQCIVAQWSLDINAFQQNLFAASGGPPPGEFSFGDSQVLATFFDDHTTVATFDVHGHGVADVGGGTLETFVDLAGGGSAKLDPRRHHAVGLERELRHPGHDPRFFNGDPVVDDPLVLDPNSSGAVGNSTFEVACDDEAGRLLMTWVDPASGVKAEMPYIRIGD